MRKAKTWIPPSIPLRDNLDAWKIICNDIHFNLIEAGLMQTDTPDQLDINAVDDLPIDGTFAGFREYAFTDTLQEVTPIIIRLEFGAGVEGLTISSNNTMRTRTLRIKCDVSCGGPAASSAYPQMSKPNNPTNTTFVLTQLTTPGISYYSSDLDQGFFAFFYGVGSRNKPHAGNSGTYYGSSLVILIQRFIDKDNSPIEGGCISWASDLFSNTGASDWANLLQVSKMYTITPAGVTESVESALSPFSLEGTVIAGASHFYPVFMRTPTGVFQMPNVVTYRMSDVATGTTFKLKSPGPTEKTFVAIGNETSMSVCPHSRARRGIAIQFENDA